jgi:hypothetical protein
MRNWTRLTLAIGVASWFTFICWQYANTDGSCYVDCGSTGMDLCPVPCDGLGVGTGIIIWTITAIGVLRFLRWLSPKPHRVAPLRHSNFIDRYGYWR